MEKKINRMTYTPVMSKIFKEDTEYYAFMEAVKVELLTFFDRVDYLDDYYRTNLQVFSGEIGPVSDPSNFMKGLRWVAQKTVFTEECLGAWKAGTLKEYMEPEIDMLKFQMKHSNLRLFNERAFTTTITY